ncbi:hypothetical protein J3Q64DRAFT_1631292 [Phycomyces blakesleeanus]|uniref:GAR domain-containing protein n=1 Tax=Phycomyces blakesleeanus TaxID=4837 RepID=A0ABR3BE50_PHYBL
MLDALCVLNLPDINTPALSHESSLEEFLDGFDAMAAEMNRWLETAHLTVFTIEQQVKQDIGHDTVRLEQTIDSVQPSIESLGDLVEVMQLKQDIPGLIERKRSVRVSITKLQSEWSGLQHFLSSVKKTIKDSTDRKDLLLLMETILLQVNDLSTLIFQFQERRHATAILYLPHEHETTDDGLMSSSSSVSSSSEQSRDYLQQSQQQQQQQQQRDDAILVEIDSKVVPLFHEVERVYGRMTSINNVDPNGVLSRKHRVVQERWESLRIEIDDLKYDLKEDRWLSVFSRVANQVESLIHKLEKTVVNCYAMIRQARDWQAAQAVLAMQTQPTKGILKTPKTDQQGTSVSSTSSSGSANGLVPVDYNKFRAVEKAFENKFKNSSSTINRMMASLGDGISKRPIPNASVVERHEAALNQWNQLKITMDDLRLRDLPDTERLLMFERPVSPAWSRFSDLSDKSQTSWKDMRYRSPEPNHNELFDYHRSGSATEVRSRSPYSYLSKRNPSPTYQPPYEEVRRGRSATPNSGTGRDSAMWRLANSNPSPVFGRTQQRTASPLSHARDPPMHLVSSALRPSASDSSSVGSPARRQTKSPVGSRVSTIPNSTSLWPIPSPTKSNHRQDSRPRSRTPSMIPRAKTPLGDRSASPCMIPRPRSSMARSSHGPRVLHKKHSTPALMQRSASPFRQRQPAHTRYSSDEDERPMEIAFRDYPSYTPNLKDPLDVEVATIVNGSPIAIKCQRGPHGGGYYFGNELNPSLGGGKKLYTCKLMNYADRDRRNATGKMARNKVLVRVGGGWQDLEIFLLEHSNLMASDVVVRSFVHNNSSRSVWR